MPSFRVAADAVARAGWAGLVLAVAGVAVGQVGHLQPPPAVAVAVFPVALLLDLVLLVALIRVLAAHRPEPVPPPPVVDEAGVRVGAPVVVPRPGPADRSPLVALRRAAALSRPILRYAALTLILHVVGVMLLLPLVLGRLEPAGGEEVSPREALPYVVPFAVVTALLGAFVVLAPQRLALEGDPRVLVAAAHSVRVARTSFGALFGLELALAAPVLLSNAAVAWERPWPHAAAAALVGVAVRLVSTALLTEVYVRGPRLDVPAEFGIRPSRR